MAMTGIIQYFCYRQISKCSWDWNKRWNKSAVVDGDFKTSSDAQCVFAAAGHTQTTVSNKGTGHTEEQRGSMLTNNNNKIKITKVLVQ